MVIWCIYVDFFLKNKKQKYLECKDVTLDIKLTYISQVQFIIWYCL